MSFWHCALYTSRAGDINCPPHSFAKQAVAPVLCAGRFLSLKIWGFLPKLDEKLLPRNLNYSTCSRDLLVVVILFVLSVLIGKPLSVQNSTNFSSSFCRPLGVFQISRVLSANIKMAILVLLNLETLLIQLLTFLTTSFRTIKLELKNHHFWSTPLLTRNGFVVSPAGLHLKVGRFLPWIRTFKRSEGMPYPVKHFQSRWLGTLLNVDRGSPNTTYNGTLAKLNFSVTR